MALNFNINPYYDDFDEAKNYHRILFKPGYAVQARELTQLQTQLQDQIKKFGEHIFVNGTIVAGPEGLHEKKLLSIKLDPLLNGNTVDMTVFDGKTIVGESSGTIATVKVSSALTAAGDPNTLLVSVKSGGPFTEGETITTTDTSKSAVIQALNPFGYGQSYSVGSSIFFVDGKFVYVEPQSIALDKYSTTPTKVIGFLVEESIITSDDDDSLLDKSQGTANYAAPGADRYSIALTLITKEVSESLNNFVEIARVVDGVLVKNVKNTIYSAIGDELARRTVDESGDYTVKKWPIQILDHQSATPDSTKFTVALDPGKGYIKGYEFGTDAQTYITLDRARDYDQADNLDVSVDFGNYVVVSNVKGLFSTNVTTTSDTAAVGNYSAVELHSAVHGSVSGSGTKIGTANVRFMQWVGSNAPGSTATYRMYLFNIKMDGSNIFGSTKSVVIRSGATVLSGGDINAASKQAGSGQTFLTGSDVPGLVFPLANQYIKTIRDSLGNTQTDYKTQRTYTGVSFTSGSASIQTDNGLERFVGGSGALSDTLKYTNFHAVITSVSNAGSTGYVVGDIIRFDTASTRSITLTTPTVGTPHQATFDVNDAAFTATVTIIAAINANTQTERVKSLSDYKIKILGTGSGGGLNVTKGGKDSLAVSDVYEVVGIYNTGTTNPTGVTIDPVTGTLTWDVVSHTDVTSRYTVDNGQRPEFYDHGNIILTGTAPTSSHYLLVVYRNFTHTGSGFLSRDSYGIPYEDIPEFIDPTSGKTYVLRDCIDFRPRRADGATTLEGGQIPDPTDTLNADYQYYLARMDRIVATADRQFVIKRGIPEVYPKVPVDESNGMTLYVVVIPPYTANVRDIQVRYFDNKRYTMRDIGRLEKRISNLEYYTQLSLLEKAAKDMSIQDSSVPPLQKFKNGFAVDPFTSLDVFVESASNPEAWANRRWGWWNAWFNGSTNWNFQAQNYNANSLAQPSNVDFNAAIDPVNQELRAPFTIQFSEFDTGTLTSTIKEGDLVTLSYTEALAINQPLASTYINVNPFNVIRFIGTITLEPSFDLWVETTYLPDVNLVVDVRVPDAADVNSTVVTAVYNAGLLFKTTGTSTTVTDTVLSSKKETLGTNVVDVQYIPYMRAKTIVGVGHTFKPKTRLYPFMEETSVTSYVRPLTLIEVQNHTGTLFDGRQGVYEALSIRTTAANSATEVATAKTAIYSSPLTTAATRRLLTVFDTTGTFGSGLVGKYVVGTNGGVAQITAVTTYSLGDSLIPDEFGNLGFEFQIPGNTFKTGERTIRLIDNSTNDTEAQESIGEGKYTAIGQIQTKQTTTLTTRTIQKQKTTVTTGYKYDPVAQSFFVYQNDYPLGFHISSIDVFFRTKSDTVPVEMQIRKNVNGYPESDPTLPFSSMVLQPDRVNVSTDGSVATTFQFANPIHLAPGEYSIVLLANTQEYQVYVAEMGGTVLGGTAKIDKQPYIGTLYVSQNASTWTPDQTKDLKFAIRRASFQSTGSAIFNIQDPDTISDYHTLFANASTVLPTGTSIKWYAKAYYGSQVFDVDWAPINIGQDINYAQLRKLAAASGIGVGGTDAPSLTLKAELSLDSSVVKRSEVSPVIDASSLSIVTALNTINNDYDYESGTNAGGNALAKYITKPVNLADGFHCTNLCVTVDINLPVGTDAKIYYKTLPTEKTTPIDDENWVEMVLEKSVPVSTSNYDFKEYRFFPPGAFDTYGVPQDSPITNDFNAFQVKIVMLSSSQAYTPRFRDLRIIALES